MQQIERTLLVGQYAQHYFLGSCRKPSLTDTTMAWWGIRAAIYLAAIPFAAQPTLFKPHSWVEEDLVPALQARINPIFAR